MAVDKKISQLASGAPAQAGDEYVVARSGANFKLTLTNIAASMPPIGATTPNTGAFTTLSASNGETISGGNLTFSSTAQRITGDFSNATESNRLAFQSSTTNGGTRVNILSNGTGTASSLDVFGVSDPTNAAVMRVRQSGTESQLLASITGTGTYLPMTFYTGGSERVRIDTSGNVGIGTSSPLRKLDIAGGGLAFTESGGAGRNIHWGDTTDIYPVTINGNATTGNCFLAFNTNTFGNAATERMRIDSSGNVGIGTASPTQRLHVNGNARFGTGAWLGFPDSAGALVRFANGEFIATTGQQLQLCADNGDGTIAFCTTSTGSASNERMRIDSSGNVGIGTASPSANTRLNVVDANRVLDSRGNLYVYTTNTAAANLGGQITLGGSYSGTTEAPFASIAGRYDGTGINGYLQFGTLASGSILERMRIDSSGNVGIGGTGFAFDKVTVTGTLPTDSNVSVNYSARGTAPSGTTTLLAGFNSFPATAAASFTCAAVSHFNAAGLTIGAGSTVTNQYGFHATPSLTGATNNYGFYSDIASGSNRWNFYAAGTAQNYMAGRLGIGNSTFLDSEMLRITQASAKVALFVEITAASSTGNPGIGIRKQDNDNTTNQTYVSFTYNAGGNGAGGIQGNGANGVQFYSSSDARLKENVADLDGQLAKILALKPRKFDFINGPKDCTGFIAQEMETVYPDAVGEDVDGFKTIGGISVMEARLIKAIQELTARVAELEAK